MTETPEEAHERHYDALMKQQMTPKEYVAWRQTQDRLRRGPHPGIMAHADAVASRENATPTPTPAQEVEVTPDPTPAVKAETVGVDWKVPIQAAVTLLAFLLSYFGVELPVEVAGAISVLLGVIAGYFGPAPKTVTVPQT